MIGQYNYSLVFVSVVVAILASYTALDLATRITASQGRSAQAWLVGGAFSMGIGIWSMHFLGMLAFSLPIAVGYDVTITLASLAIAIVIAGFALYMVSRASLGMRELILGGILMGLGICGMHYTGMAAAQFAANTICTTGPLVDNSWMAGVIAGATFLVLCATLCLSVIDARMASKAAMMADSLRHANDELQHLALHDSLTKLPNRALLEDRIAQAIGHARRSMLGCAILFVDLDRFKTINDSLGHFVGDELLKGVALRLRGLVRAEDTVSRLGGDEFVILLCETADTEEATGVAAKIVAALREPFRVQHQELYVTPSVGVSVYPMHGENAQTLITSADAAMYNVKQAGRNDVRVFASEMSTFFPERLMLENDLRGALEREEFVLFYQPKVDVGSGETVGMEALVRWRHPEKGLVAPDRFIPLAEETGLIVPIGRWVIHEACRQNKAWQDSGMPELRIAVNISGLQFRQKDLLDTIAASLHATGLSPECLEVEITESVVMHNASEAIVTLEKLSRMGVHVSIDDFGTGYSSLSYLKRFPIDTLKIDRSFIRDVSSDMDDAAIVRATIGLAHNLRLRVVAEGVETAEQLHFLRSLGCDEYQGYHKSRPLPAAEFERNLRAEWPQNTNSPVKAAA